MAGEPLDQPTHEWFQNELQKPVIDNYWQTETGWPMLAALPASKRPRSSSVRRPSPVYGYNLRFSARTVPICGANERASPP